LAAGFTAGKATLRGRTGVLSDAAGQSCGAAPSWGATLIKRPKL